MAQVWQDASRIVYQREKSREKPYTNAQKRRMKLDLERMVMIQRIEAKPPPHELVQTLIRWWFLYVGGNEAFERFESETRDG